MFRKVKTYLLIATCLLLFGCSRACDLLYLYIFDRAAFVYVVMQDLIQGIDPYTGNKFTVPATFSDLFTVYAANPNPNSMGYFGIGSRNSKALIYIINRSSNQVLVFDPNSDTVRASIAVGNRPTFGVISRDNRWLFVSNTMSDSLSRIDLANNTVSNTIQLPTGSRPTNIAMSFDGLILYYINSLQNSLTSYSLSTMMPVMTTSVGKTPISMAITPDGSSLWVGNAGDNSLSIIDTLTMQGYKTITGIDMPTCINFKRDGSAAWITNRTNGTLTVMKLLDYKFKTFKVGLNPSYVTGDAHGTNVYVANQGSNSVTVLKGLDYSELMTIPVTHPPLAIASLF